MMALTRESMRARLACFVLLTCLIGCSTPASAQDEALASTPEHWPRCPPDLPDRYSVQALRHERNDDRLFCSAVDVARTDDPLALRILGAVLSEPDFLDRLDAAGQTRETWQTMRLNAVLGALAENTSSAAGKLCSQLYAEPALLADPARAQATRRLMATCLR